MIDSLDRAKKKYRQFHLKEPNNIVDIPTEIPRIVVPVGFCAQLSYNSNKWNKESKWNRYIHWWENLTLVCVPEEMAEDLCEDTGFYTDQQFDLGPGRKEVTFLGYAIDFNLTNDDRSKIKISSEIPFTTEDQGEIERLEESLEFNFNDRPRQSTDYVACSPNGRIVYIIAGNGKEIYAFMNDKCRVTAHGIEG